MMPVARRASRSYDREAIGDCVAELGDIVDALESLQAHLGRTPPSR